MSGMSVKIAIGSDTKNHVTDTVIEYLTNKGFKVDLYGALNIKADKMASMWSRVAMEVAKKVSDSSYQQAILFCFTGTGVTIAANKIKGIRAALCNDAATAKGAKRWNDANILTMSLRLVSEDLAKEILDAWLSNSFSDDEEDIICLNYLKEIEL